jgi:hypothetical protein
MPLFPVMDRSSEADTSRLGTARPHDDYYASTYDEKIVSAASLPDVAPAPPPPDQGSYSLDPLRGAREPVMGASDYHTAIDTSRRDVDIIHSTYPPPRRVPGLTASVTPEPAAPFRQPSPGGIMPRPPTSSNPDDYAREAKGLAHSRKSPATQSQSRPRTQPAFDSNAPLVVPTAPVDPR